MIQIWCSTQRLVEALRILKTLDIEDVKQIGFGSPLSDAQKNIVVIGAGISGLSTASVCSSAGHNVTVLFDQPASKTVSTIAGALWEWPPAVCGHHNDVKSLTRSAAWAARSYQVFAEQSLMAGTGVFFRPSNFYFKKPVRDSVIEWTKLNDSALHVRDLIHNPNLILENGINETLGLEDAYRYLAPVIETPVYSQWLQDNLKSRGIRYVKRKISGRLSTQTDLFSEFSADWIINCAGLGAEELAGDSLYPLRGALIKFDLPTERSEQFLAAHCIANDESIPQQNMVYIVPRSDCLLLGGFAEPNRWETDLTFESYHEVEKVYQRGIEFLPSLKELSISKTTPVLCGLRPARKANVRLEADDSNRIIHNYGHGGSGYSLAWGCAEEVVRLIAEVS